MSSRLLTASGYPFDAANIPVCTNGTFCYSPDVHRILQLSVNLFDATGNHHGGTNGLFFPTVLRPTFRQQPNGSDVDIYISGFSEVGAVTGFSDPQFSIPLDLSDPEDRVAAGTAPGQNIYGVPWLIGVKKGFPNFNEFAMQSVAQISRKLQIRKLVPGRATFIATNQMFIVGVSNAFGFEAWNSYAANYPRATELLVANDVTMTLGFTNDPMFDLRGGSAILRLNLTGRTNFSAGNWAGRGSDSGSPNRASFVVPLTTNIVFLPDSIFRTASGTAVFTTNIAVGQNLAQGFEQTGRFHLPQFNFAVSNRIRFIAIDSDTGRVIDYVQLNGLDGARNLSTELAAAAGSFVDGAGTTRSEAIFWQTNRLGGNTINNQPMGLKNQIDAALGNIDVPDWNSVGIGQSAGLTRNREIDSFRVFMGLTPKYGSVPPNTNTILTVPFTPTRKTSQYLTWQANDPLVHHQSSDLAVLGAGTGIVREQPSGIIRTIRNIGALNDRFEPWGGSPASSSDFTSSSVPAFDPAFKDPLIYSSDDWDFPANGPLAFAWVGKVHRGTPWQTLYLKSATLNLNTWQKWTGVQSVKSAVRTLPVTDRPLFDSLLRLLNTDNPNRLLSVNARHADQWRRVLNRTTVLTNTATDAELDSFPPIVRYKSSIMRAGDQQAATIADAIVETRGNRMWEDVSDVLATLELAESSPWLNVGSATQLRRGISDEAYEKIASQLLPRLRADSKGTARITRDGRALEFTGYDGSHYAIEASNDLIHWHRIGRGIPTNGVFRFTDPTPPATGSRFYRSVMLP